MKKIIVLCLVVLLLLTGCSKDIDKRSVYMSAENYRLVTIEPNGVIYVQGINALALYYSPNGKLCHYVNGEIVEID